MVSTSELQDLRCRVLGFFPLHNSCRILEPESRDIWLVPSGVIAPAGGDSGPLLDAMWFIHLLGSYKGLDPQEAVLTGSMDHILGLTLKGLARTLDLMDLDHQVRVLWLRE